jgi:hypothetical protein
MNVIKTISSMVLLEEVQTAVYFEGPTLTDFGGPTLTDVETTILGEYDDEETELDPLDPIETEPPDAWAELPAKYWPI